MHLRYNCMYVGTYVPVHKRICMYELLYVCMSVGLSVSVCLPVCMYVCRYMHFAPRLYSSISWESVQRLACAYVSIHTHIRIYACVNVGMYKQLATSTDA